MPACGRVRTPSSSSWRHKRLAELHARYVACGVRNRDNLKQMQRYDAGFTGKNPRF